MKALGVILAITGIGNLIVGILALSQGAVQATSHLLQSILYVAASIYCFHRIARKKKEKEEFEKWNNPDSGQNKKK